MIFIKIIVKQKAVRRVSCDAKGRPSLISCLVPRPLPDQMLPQGRSSDKGTETLSVPTFFLGKNLDLE